MLCGVYAKHLNIAQTYTEKNILVKYLCCKYIIIDERL